MTTPKVDIGMIGKIFILLIVIFLVISQLSDCDFTSIWDLVPFMGPGNQRIRVLG
jgi:hypothetical protein